MTPVKTCDGKTNAENMNKKHAKVLSKENVRNLSQQDSLARPQEPSPNRIEEIERELLMRRGQQMGHLLGTTVRRLSSACDLARPPAHRIVTNKKLHYRELVYKLPQLTGDSVFCENNGDGNPPDATARTALY
jgi:hypothetical protein